MSTGCWAMLENGTSTEYLMLCNSWITMFETILNEGFVLPAGNIAFLTVNVLKSKVFFLRCGGTMKNVWIPRSFM